MFSTVTTTTTRIALSNSIIASTKAMSEDTSVSFVITNIYILVI